MRYDVVEYGCGVSPTASAHRVALQERSTQPTEAPIAGVEAAVLLVAVRVRALVRGAVAVVDSIIWAAWKTTLLVRSAGHWLLIHATGVMLDHARRALVQTHPAVEAYAHAGPAGGLADTSEGLWSERDGADLAAARGCGRATAHHCLRQRTGYVPDVIATGVSEGNSGIEALAHRCPKAQTHGCKASGWQDAIAFV